MGALNHTSIIKILNYLNDENKSSLRNKYINSGGDHLSTHMVQHTAY